MPVYVRRKRTFMAQTIVSSPTVERLQHLTSDYAVGRFTDREFFLRRDGQYAGPLHRARQIAKVEIHGTSRVELWTAERYDQNEYHSTLLFLVRDPGTENERVSDQVRVSYTREVATAVMAVALNDIQRVRL